jgi:Arc/MetJ-type ribon-helix-helix transcriptional regulator
MTTISIPVDRDTDIFIQSMIKLGKYENKAQVVRRALYIMKEEELLRDLHTAEQEYKDGKGIKGDLKNILKSFND